MCRMRSWGHPLTKRLSSALFLRPRKGGAAWERPAAAAAAAAGVAVIVGHGHPEEGALGEERAEVNTDDESFEKSR